MGRTALLSRKSPEQAIAPLYHEGWPDNRVRQAFPDNPRVRIAHLLRRAGFGGDRATLDEYAAIGIDGAVDRLLSYEQATDDPADRIPTPRFPLGQKTEIAAAVGQLQQWWLQRMAVTSRPLLEKMVLFWHGHLTSGVSKVRLPELMRRQNEFFRQNATGAFDTILRGISRDAAMMVWLDNATNRKQRPNENYARELMELFSMGEGEYTEQDVKEVARAFTGWTIDRRTGEFVELRNQHDAGPKTVLGHTGNLDGDDVIDIIVRHPAAGPFISRELFSFFAYPNPDPDVLQPISDAYYRSGFSVKETLRAILTSDAFFSDQAYRARVKSPTEFVVGIVSTLGLKTDFTGMPLRLARMGQALFDPPSVGGWPGGPAWINTSTWMERMNLLHSLSTAPAQAIQGLPEFIEALNGRPGPAAVDTMVALLLDGDISSGARQVLLDFAGSRLTAARARDLLYLVLGSPEYQLA